MSPYAIFVLGARWLHTLAMIAWVGGGIFYLFALSPIFKGNHPFSDVSKKIAQEFKNVVDIAIWGLVVTGAILFLDRLTSDYAKTTYGVILGIKIAISVWMINLVWFRWRGRFSLKQLKGKDSTHSSLRKLQTVFSGPNLILILGILVVLLSNILGYLYEKGIGGV